MPETGFWRSLALAGSSQKPVEVKLRPCLRARAFNVWETPFKESGFPRPSVNLQASKGTTFGMFSPLTPFRTLKLMIFIILKIGVERSFGELILLHGPHNDQCLTADVGGNMDAVGISGGH